ncbi:MAG: hypothetical protein JNM93_01520 [Bacteriovoracaceae bacterium]|nr:hypothetical protein [Bacteriovoracaceae bacterium]
MSPERKKHDVANDTEAIKAVLNLLKTQIEFDKNQHLLSLIDSSLKKMDVIKQQLLKK